jgi:hypothetical protein
MMIIKAFFNKHIDLTKIVAVSDAYFIDRMGHGGWFVGFDIDVQLLDKPIKYTRPLTDGEYFYEFKADRSGRGHVLLYSKDEKTPVCVENLQKQIDGLIQQWKEAVE